MFDLPLELFSSVCSYLDDDLIRSIRLVFRAINDRSTGYTSIWIFESSGLVPTIRPATHQFRLSFLTPASLLCLQLRELRLVRITGPIGFHEGHGGLNVWRQLQESGMRSVYFHNTMITRFFNAYQGTLTRIGLTYVLLDSGSWTDIVQTIHDLPFLETLSLYY
jgi:hypothetical protein